MPPLLQGIIIVYDITSVNSFSHLTKWMGYVQTVIQYNIMQLDSIVDTYITLRRYSTIQCHCIQCIVYLFMYLYPPTSGQHATADVSLMLLGSKLDLEDRREVSREEGQKVRTSSAYRSLPVAVCLGGSLFVISAWVTMTLEIPINSCRRKQINCEFGICSYVCQRISFRCCVCNRGPAVVGQQWTVLCSL